MKTYTWLPNFNVSSESDTELLSYFYKSNLINDIFTKSKWLVLGRKGSGKTAIYKYLESKPSELKDHLIVALNFKDYPWPVHKIFKDSMEGDLTAYQKSWKYIFIVKSLAEIIKNKEDSHVHLSAELKTAKDILNKLYNNPFPSLIEVFKSNILRLNSVTLPNANLAEAKIELGSFSLDDVPGSNQLQGTIRNNVFVLSAYLESILIKSLQEQKVTFVLDQLDENWLEDQINEYSKILINLLNVCRSFNTETRFNNLEIKIFLRTDIFETLKFNDKNKVYQDNAVEISWDEERLNEMFFQRITKYKPKDLKLDLPKKSNCLFEVSYVRHGATPIKHMTRRSFMRPRDLVVFFNKVRETSKDNDEDFYSSKSLYAAEKSYSVSMYNELIDEWSNQRKDFETLLSVLTQIEYQTFSYSRFEEIYLKVFKDRNTGNVKEDLILLFKNSIIGQKEQAHWTYFCTKPFLNIDFNKDFHVNYALKSRLSLTEKRTVSSDGNAVEVEDDE